MRYRKGEDCIDTFSTATGCKHERWEYIFRRINSELVNGGKMV